MQDKSTGKVELKQIKELKTWNRNIMNLERLLLILRKSIGEREYAKLPQPPDGAVFGP